MDLNCGGSLMCGFFSVVNTMVLHEPQLFESADVEPQTWRNADSEEPHILRSDCKVKALLIPALLKSHLHCFKENRNKHLH